MDAGAEVRYRTRVTDVVVAADGSTGVRVEAPDGSSSELSAES